jgi:hypothetical protein
MSDKNKLEKMAGDLFDLSVPSINGEEVVTQDIVSGQLETVKTIEMRQLIDVMNQVEAENYEEEKANLALEKMTPKQQSFGGSDWNGVSAIEMPRALSTMHPDAAGQSSILIRSAFFKRVRPGRRRKLKREKIASHLGINIWYTGDELSVQDEMVWMSCLRICRRVPEGQFGFISQADFLADLGWHDNGTYKQNLEGSLKRLRECRAKVFMKSKRSDLKIDTDDNLISVYRAEQGGNVGYMIRLEIGSYAIFKMMTYVSWDTHKQLRFGGHEKGDFYAQINLLMHVDEPRRRWHFEIDVLRTYWGFTHMSLKRFTENLASALDVLAKKGFVSEVIFTKQGSAGMGPEVSWIRLVNRLEFSEEDIKQLPFKAAK